MRALVVRQFGGPEVLGVEEVPEPVAGLGESLIDVHFAGVNYADLRIRCGALAPPRLPAVLGADVVGRRRGDRRRVAALLRRGGGYAEVAAAVDAYTIDLPDDIDDHQAVALLEQGCAAYAALTTLGRLRPGESVAVTAAAGGVGHFAVQLARAANAGPVVGVASTPAKRALVRSLGADHAIGDPALVAATVPGGVDLWLDSLGGPHLRTALAGVAPFGRVVSVGVREAQPCPVTVADLAERSVGVLGLWMGQVLADRPLFARIVARLFGLARQGWLTGHVDRVVPLAHVGAAHRDLEAGRTMGKLLIDVRR